METRFIQSPTNNAVYSQGLFIKNSLSNLNNSVHERPEKAALQSINMSDFVKGGQPFSNTPLNQTLNNHILIQDTNISSLPPLLHHGNDKASIIKSENVVILPLQKTTKINNIQRNLTRIGATSPSNTSAFTTISTALNSTCALPSINSIPLSTSSMPLNKTIKTEYLTPGEKERRRLAYRVPINNSSTYKVI